MHPHKDPLSLDQGMGRILSVDQIKSLLIEDGRSPENLPDIILYGEDRGMVRSLDHTHYLKLVLEGGYWYCGCEIGKFCLHTEAIQTYLEKKPQSQLTQRQRLAQIQRDHHRATMLQIGALRQQTSRALQSLSEEASTTQA